MSIVPSTSGNFPTYRFYLTYLTITYEVFPLNFNETQLVDELEKDQVFYRRKFKGTLLFGTNDKVIDVSGAEQNRMDDFTLLWGIETIDPCARLDLMITRTLGGVIDTYWEGFFSTTDGTPDIDKCTFEVTPLTDDDYTGILEKENIKTNLFDILSTITTVGDFTHMGVVSPVSYTRNRWLYHDTQENLLAVLAEIVKPGVTLSSTFFSAAINPATLDDNMLTRLTIAQKSDIKFPTATDGASGDTGLISWGDLMTILWTMFQVKWNYDSTTDTINVEHISFFNQIDGVDLRTQLVTQSTNRYSYRKEVMPKYERFLFMEASEPNFIGKEIWYDSNCVDPNPETNISENKINITTDIEYILDDVTYTGGDNIDNNGFVILCNYQVGAGIGATYFIRMNYGKLDGTAHRNIDLSWANLHDLYFRHERVLIDGYMNDVLTDFWTGRKVKIQECNAIICKSEGYIPEDLITTELGETYFGGVKASVNRAEISPSGAIAFSLIYPPDENTNTGVDNLMGAFAFVDVQANDDAADTWTAYIYLNNAAPVGGISIRVRVKMYTAGSVLDCTTGWGTISIAAGDWSGTVSDDLCNELASIDCVVFEIEYDDANVDYCIGAYMSGGAQACAVPFIYTVI